MSETVSQEELADIMESCTVCGLQGVRAPSTDINFEEEMEIPNYISSVYVKPILTELFPNGFGGKPYEYMLARSFILPFCSECEAEVRGVLSAKTEIENLRRLIDASLNCVRIKSKERNEADDYPDEESRVLGQHILGIQQNKAKKTKKADPAELPAVEQPPSDSESAPGSYSGKRKVPLTASDVGEKKVDTSQKATRTRRVKKPARYGDATSETKLISPRKAEGGLASTKPGAVDDEQVDLNDHSDLIGFTVDIEASDMVDADPEWKLDANISNGEKRDDKGRKGRPRGSSKKPPKVIKQVQGPKVFSEEIEPGVYKYKDHVFRSRTDGKWECDTCHVIMKGRHNCLVHITNTHLGKGKGVFECEICGKIYDRSTTLKIHREIHRGKSFMCQWCGKLFAQRGNLKQHVMTHEGELNHVCDFDGCGKRFLLPKQLRLHRMRHENNRPYLCEHCPKRYLVQAELDNHLRTHTGERPYTCSICPSAFFIKGRLARHYKKVHRISPETFRVNAVLPADSVPVAYVLTEV